MVPIVNPIVNRKKSEVGDEFITPRWVWEPWHESLCFVLDVAATPSNRLPVCGEYYTRERLPEHVEYYKRKHDAFKQDWAADVLRIRPGAAAWCNPPYSRSGGPLRSWVAKGLEEAAKGLIVCMLLPADTSTDWFSLLWDRLRGEWLPGVHGYFIDTRVRFIDPRTMQKTKGSPNFGSLIVVMDQLACLQDASAAVPSRKSLGERGIRPSRAAGSLLEARASSTRASSTPWARTPCEG